MMKYTVTITETLERSILIDAESHEQAIEQAEELIAKEEIVLDADDFTHRDFEAAIFPPKQAFQFIHFDHDTLVED